MDLAHLFSTAQAICNYALVAFGALAAIARYTPWDAQIEKVLSAIEAPFKAVLSFLGGNPPPPPAPPAQ